MWAKKPAAERAPTGRPGETVRYRLAGTLNNMTTTTETVLSTPIVRKPAEENGEKPQQRSADWENPRVASILSAAAKCFARKGFTATTLAEIGKELGLRKSIVHYYFASKAALIHEVQSYTYHRYLDRLREAIKNGDGSVAQTTDALRALWDAVQNNKTGTGLNIEVWSAARRDVELKRRAAGLHRDARGVIRDALGPAAQKGGASRAEALATLSLAVLNGLSVTEYLEGDDAKVKEAYEAFLGLLRQGLEAPSNVS
jgi:AcrR family transcriptional regulator